VLDLPVEDVPQRGVHRLRVNRRVVEHVLGVRHDDEREARALGVGPPRPVGRLRGSGSRQPDRPKREGTRADQTAVAQEPPPRESSPNLVVVVVVFAHAPDGKQSGEPPGVDSGNSTRTASDRLVPS
jgi:hypothetical protein